MKYTNTVIIVFAKAPIAGKVNTRLIPDIGVDKATQLQHDLVHKRLADLKVSKLCQVVLYCSPDKQDEFFTQSSSQYSVLLENQQGVNLGERMANAISDQLNNYSNVIVVGTDAPSLNIEKIEMAINGLNDNDVVIVPAEDGGYVLIGMNKAYRVLFNTVAWGTDRVLIKTRANIIAAGLKHIELDTCWDIDRVEDYNRYIDSITQL